MPNSTAPTEQLREAIAAAPSENQVAKESGVPQQRINAFMRGGTIRSDTLDRLARYFGLRLTRDPKRRK